jgi:hypothetical protein
LFNGATRCAAIATFVIQLHYTHKLIFLPEIILPLEKLLSSFNFRRFGFAAEIETD